MFENDYTSEKSFVLKSLSIISSNGQDINIYPQLVELSIFEDIYNSTISGMITLSDSQDFFAKIPLSGFEFISLTIGKPGSEKEIIFDKIFRIYKMSGGEVKPVTTSNQVYTLYFCSEENIISVSRRISKSYRGKTTSQIIKDILTNQLAISPQKIQNQNIENTFGVHDIIIPYMNPLAAISWLTARTVSATSKSSGANYMFYENTQGYNFRSLESLFQKTSKAKYSYKVKNVDFPEDTTVSEIRDVIKYEFMNNFDILAGITSGMFSSILKGIDLVKLQANDTVMNYKEFFNNSTHIENNNSYTFQNEYQDRLKNKIYQNYFSVTRMYPTNRGHNNDPTIAPKQPSIKQNFVELWMLQRMSQISQLNYFKLKLVIPGDTYLTVGDIIEFDLPLVTSKDPGVNNKNLYYSGRYLITAIRHIIDIHRYEMVIEATRDCLAEPYPEAQNSNRGIDILRKQ